MSAAHLQLVHDANRVRTPPRMFREDPVVQITFTAFAPGPCAAGGVLTLYRPDIDGVARELARRLGVPIAELQLQGMAIGDVAVLRRMPQDVAPEYGPGTIRPIAFVDGVAADDLSEALRWILETARERA